MDKKNISLNLLPIGKKAIVKTLESKGNIRRRLLDLGFVNNTIVEAVQKSPSGDPVAYNIRGAVIALRSDETEQIFVEIL